MTLEHEPESARGRLAEQFDAIVIGAGEAGASTARFRSPREVVVRARALRAQRIFIATGLRPLIPEIPGLDTGPYLTSETLMELTEIPAHLVVIGGGYVACELGQAFRRFGSQVTILQRAQQLVPNEEPDVSTILGRAFEAEGIRVLCGHAATRIEHGAGGVRVFARNGQNDETTVEGSHLRVTAARRPNTDSLALDAAGVEVDGKGHVTVNDYLETTAPAVWAVGDVNGRQPITRTCQGEGKVAYAIAFEGARLTIQRESLGYAVFTDPEIGSVGLTERGARERGAEIAVGLITFDEIEKASLIGETAGLIKYVVERSSRRLLGCHVIGPNGADLVYAGILVARQGGTLNEKR